MIMTDTSEFHMASTIRDGDNFFSPRSPGFNEGDITPIFHYDKASFDVNTDQRHNEDTVSFNNSDIHEEP